MSWNWMINARAVVTIALAVALGACGDDDGGTGIDRRANGTYTLQQVDGKALPVTALTREDQNGKWEGRIESGTLQLADGNYDASFIVDVLLNGTTSFEDFVFEDRGTYRIDGNRISFQSSTVGLDRFDGTLDGDVLTVSQPVEDYGTITAVYQR